MSRLHFQFALLLKLDTDTIDEIKSKEVPEDPKGTKMYPLSDDMLHITLTSGRSCKPHKEELSTKLPTNIEPPQIKLGECKFVYRPDLNKTTWVACIDNQEDFKNYVDSIYNSMGLQNPEPERFFHITIANNVPKDDTLFGNPFGSIGDVKKEDFIKESKEEKTWQVWFDLDGVLADFEGGLYKDEPIKLAKQRLDDLIDKDFPQYAGLKPDELKIKIKEDLLKDSTLKQLKSTFYAYNNLVYKIAGQDGFFANLNLLPGAYEMIEAATQITGVKPNVCTAPMGDENDPNNSSVIEKKEWVKKHFGDKINHVEVTLDKGRVVESKFDILIDDRQKYCDKFTAAGGTAIKHETPNSSNLASWKDTIKKLEMICMKRESRWIKTFERFKRTK